MSSPHIPKMKRFHLMMITHTILILKHIVKLNIRNRMNYINLLDKQRIYKQE